MLRTVYMDYAATTPMAPEAAEAMRPYLAEDYGNPSGIYALARRSREAVKKARRIIADTLNTEPENIYFTSGGTESDNWALIAAAEAFNPRGRHIITSKIEHHAILNTCHYLEKRGFDVTYVDVDREGLVKVSDVEAAIRRDTILVSIMAANNEIGTIEPVADIGRLCQSKGILFHTDAVQAYGHLPIDAGQWHMDMLSASAHKFNGPKGTGFLYIKNNHFLKPFIHGGSQEMRLRAGTENVAGIAGMGCAAALAHERMEVFARRESALRNRLIYRLCSELPYVRLNGSKNHRLSNNASFCIDGADSTSMLVMLDMAGISASGGSACASRDAAPSHVLKAIGLSDAEASSALRLTLCAAHTEEDIDYTVEQVKRIVTSLRYAGR